MNNLSIVFDAMGVIYTNASTVTDLLCPIIKEKGGLSDCGKVYELYKTASLGLSTSEAFWKAAGLTVDVEDYYISKFRLTDNFEVVLYEMMKNGIKAYCLSNDVSEWAHKLQDRFGLKKYLKGSLISGDVGIRKPDPTIYEKLIGIYRINPKECIFVDDRSANLQTADQIGMKTIQYTEHFKENGNHYKEANNVKELLEVVYKIINEEIGS